MYAAETTVPVAKSRAEIETLLARHGCTQFSSGSNWETYRAVVQFKAHARVVRFVLALPNPADRIYTHDKRSYRRTPGKVAEIAAQALRQKWRALLLVIKAKLEAVESGITVFEEEFLPFIVLPNGKTVAETVIPEVQRIYQTGQMTRLLTGGVDDGTVVEQG